MHAIHKLAGHLLFLIDLLIRVTFWSGSGLMVKARSTSWSTLVCWRSSLQLKLRRKSA